MPMHHRHHHQDDNTEAWSHSSEGLRFWNWTTSQRETLDCLEEAIAMIQKRLKKVESEELFIELAGLEKRFEAVKSSLAKSPGEVRALWNRTTFDGEYYRYVW